MNKEEKQFKALLYFFSVCMMILVACAVISIVSGCCNLNMSNVMTSGTASDLIDDTDTIKSDPVISPNLTIPAI